MMYNKRVENKSYERELVNMNELFNSAKVLDSKGTPIGEIDEKDLRTRECTEMVSIGTLTGVGVAGAHGEYHYYAVPVMDKVIIEPTSEDFIMPAYAKDGDSGMDVFATKDMILEPGGTALMDLGFKMEIPRHPYHALGYRWECQARPRSGISLKTAVRVSNAPGTIDNGYINNVGIILTNTDTDVLFIDSTFLPSIVRVFSPHASNLKGEKELIGYDNFNNEDIKKPKNSVIIHKGDRIAQLVFNEVIRPMGFTIGTVTTESDRQGGFGHTGI